MLETVFACVAALLAVFGAYCIVRLFISELLSPCSAAIEVGEYDDAESIYSRISEAALRFPDGRIYLLVGENSSARELVAALDTDRRVKIIIVKDPDTEEKGDGE